MMKFPVVRVEEGDPLDRSKWIPLSKVEQISINLDGTDRVMLNGEWYDCYEGYFGITDYFSEELEEEE